MIQNIDKHKLFLLSLPKNGWNYKHTKICTFQWFHLGNQQTNINVILDSLTSAS